MTELILEEKGHAGITGAQLAKAIKQSVAGCQGLKRVLLVVPDYTRYHSNAGNIANLYYHFLEPGCHVNLLVALGTHAAMTPDECRHMYGDIPFDRFIMHNWRKDTVHLGTVPGKFVAKVSGNLLDTSIDVEVSRHVMQGEYDLVLSVGQVVPHEIVGMANQSKNIFVGCGGFSIINLSHMLGAFYGMERIMGRDKTPVRQVFDYAQEHFLKKVPLCYVLTVTTAPGGNICTHGLYIGRGRKYFEAAVAKAQQTNMILVDKPLKKVVVYLNETEFRSTWIGNKSIYRTRMAIADGGELIVLAPGVEKFGEDAEIDPLIRKYGYCGREKVLQLVEENADLRDSLSAAAHLIHGSSDGRFSITYCTQHLTKQEVERALFGYLPYQQAARMYNPQKLLDGFNTLPNGDEIYYISKPSLGLWASKDKFEGERGM
ncbi:nickel-dependent lactate racemase [Ruminococcaceae bacterium OttesenSCG-928-A16]|nr:nickel-dependent lactate racemase [Ruminococcaceae bacterium OttesenSCG-928-A16]